METSPGRDSSFEYCKQSCEDMAGGQSITFLNNGWCSHFSTPCTNTRTNNKAAATLRLSAGSDTTSTAAPVVTIGQ